MILSLLSINHIYELDLVTLGTIRVHMHRALRTELLGTMILALLSINHIYELDLVTLDTVRVHMHRALRTELLGARKRNFCLL